MYMVNYPETKKIFHENGFEIVLTWNEEECIGVEIWDSDYNGADYVFEGFNAIENFMLFLENPDNYMIMSCNNQPEIEFQTDGEYLTICCEEMSAVLNLNEVYDFVFDVHNFIDSN